MKYIITFILAVNVQLLNAQLVTDDLIHPVDLAQYTMAGYGVNVSNVSYSGNLDAFGSFDGANTFLPFNEGIIMTTGTVKDNGYGLHGPNDESDTGLDVGTPGYEPLNSLANEDTYNAAILEFDVVVNYDSIQLDYIFGSEEYPEFTGSQFTDAMAIFISGPGFGNDTVNIALTPNTNQGININTINESSNSFLYVDNGDGLTAPYNENPQYIQYDGYTTPMKAIAAVEPGETYHMIIAIADGGDGHFDSGIFIKANSLTTSTNENHPLDKISIYPNPVRSEFTINNIDPTEIEDLKIISTTGKEIQFNQNYSSNSKLQVKLKNASPGIYWVKFFTKNGKLYTSKLLVK